MQEQTDMFGESELNFPEHHSNPNPIVRKHGLDPEGRKCKDCGLFFYHERARKYYKCALRGYSHGPGTDHRCNWDACRKFRKEKLTVDEVKEIIKLKKISSTKECC